MANQKSSYLTIQELDEAGKKTKTYVCNDSAADNTKFRIDIVSAKSNVHTIATSPFYLRPRLLLAVQYAGAIFLPSGFPHTVKPDYVSYQIYNVLQAFLSSIASLLASRAVLEGIGVGQDATTTSTPGKETPNSTSATAVVLLNILQESMGRLATILFAWRLGTALEPEAKRFRLAADVFNDMAMVMECFSPMIPTSSAHGWYIRISILSSASVLRALCGVTAGSSKATLRQYFVVEERGGTVGELSAKESSQETVSSLIGMWAGSLVLSLTAVSRAATWITLLGLLGVHLGINYLAVRSVCMTSLNRQRANIVFSTLIEKGTVLSPTEVARQELIFSQGAALRSEKGRVLGHCQIGVGLEKLLGLMGATKHDKSGAVADSTIPLQSLLSIFQNENYLLFTDRGRGQAAIVLNTRANVADELKAWSHALLIAMAIGEGRIEADEKEPSMLQVIKETLRTQQETFPTNLARLQAAGWDTKTAALETRPGVRIEVE